MTATERIGTIVWTDLTVENASEIRDFYAQVVGWEHTGQDMGGYEDFNMNQPSTGKTITGICHARGKIADFPPVWMVYVGVEDIEASVEAVEKLGGAVVVPISDFQFYRIAIIKDPAGAILGLLQETSAS